MKLELKHLAPYLPYELKIARLSIDGDFKRIEYSFRATNLVEVLRYDNLKPILRPLSDLTKEIEEGKQPIAEWLMLCKDSKGVWSFDTNDFSTWNVMAVINEVNLLFKNHFDVFGLIEKGLAIDINTLPQS